MFTFNTPPEAEHQEQPNQLSGSIWSRNISHRCNINKRCQDSGDITDIAARKLVPVKGMDVVKGKAGKKDKEEMEASAKKPKVMV